MIPKEKQVVIVPSTSALGTGHVEGETRFVQQTGVTYKWDSTTSEWVVTDTGGEVEYSLIQGGL